MSRNRDYWRAVAKPRNRWIAGLPEMYGVEKRLARGGSTLLSGLPAADGSTGEADLLGDIRGRRLLHLGCGPGHDSVSWANLGARVTAVDFVEEHLRECRRLASRTSGATAGLSSSAGDPSTPRAEDAIEALVADVVHLPFCSATFDAVYAAGLVAWIDDLAALYREVARVLLPGGRFLSVEEHPIRMTLGDDGAADPANHPYRDQALRNRIHPTILPWPMPEDELETDDYLWTTGTLVTRMIEAGLEIEKLLEPSWCQVPATPDELTPATLPTCLVVVAKRPTQKA